MGIVRVYIGVSHILTENGNYNSGAILGLGLGFVVVLLAYGKAHTGPQHTKPLQIHDCSLSSNILVQSACKLMFWDRCRVAGFRALGEGGRWKMYSKEIQRKSAGKAEYLPQPNS